MSYSVLKNTSHILRRQALWWEEAEQRPMTAHGHTRINCYLTFAASVPRLLHSMSEAETLSNNTQLGNIQTAHGDKCLLKGVEQTIFFFSQFFFVIMDGNKANLE